MTEKEDTIIRGSRALILPADASMIDAYTEGYKDAIIDIIFDLGEYQMDIGCTYCECEEKMYVIQKIYGEKLEQLK